MKQITLDELSNSIASLNFKTSLLMNMWTFLYVYRRRPQDVGRGHPMELHVVKYGDILRYYIGLFSRGPQDVEDLLWSYSEKHMTRSIGRLLGTLSERNFVDWVVYIQT